MRAVRRGSPFLLCKSLHFVGMALHLTLRAARISDLAAVDGLLSRSYVRLLAPDYSSSVMVLALPIISRARPELLTSGRYYLAFAESGGLVGAGGWSMATPGPSDQPEGHADAGIRTGHVRHLAVDPAAVRQGVARRIMTAVFEAARAKGVLRMECLSTRTAVPFYTSVGFAAIGPVDVRLRPGIVFPAVQMTCDLT